MPDRENVKSIKNKKDASENDLDFILWKAELNKELLCFWKSLIENYQEK